MCYARAVSLTWSCRLSVAEYAALARKAPAPRELCPRCARPMAFDGSYPRLVREAGTVQRIFVHRARCGHCRRSEALLPHFVVRRRHDSVSSIGAAVLARHGVELPADASELYRSVPQRTVRSWHERFSERAEELWARLEALTIEWGGRLPFPPEHADSSSAWAIQAMGYLWRAAQDRWGLDLPTAWSLANVVFGSGLLATRVDLPWPIQRSRVGRFEPP